MQAARSHLQAVLCLSFWCGRGPASLNLFLVVLQVAGKSTHLAPGYLFIANILCLCMAGRGGRDATASSPSVWRGPTRALRPWLHPGFSLPRALVCMCCVCPGFRAQLGQGLGGGGDLHLLTEKLC